MTQGADLTAADVDLVHEEELDLGDRAAVQLLDHVLGVRALDLEAVVVTVHSPAHGGRRRAIVAADVDVPLAFLGLELDPVHRRGAAHEQIGLLGQAEQDAVADDVARVAQRHHLLGPVHREIGEGVDGQVAEELARVGAFHQHLGHVVRLVEQHRGVAPGELLVAEVGELRGDDRVDVGAQLRVAQQFDRVAALLKHFLQIFCTHIVTASCCGVRRCVRPTFGSTAPTDQERLGNWIGMDGPTV